MKNLFITFLLLFSINMYSQTATYWLEDNINSPVYGILPSASVINIGQGLPYTYCDTTNTWVPPSSNWTYIIRSDRKYEINNMYRYRKNWLNNLNKVKKFDTKPVTAGSN